MRPNVLFVALLLLLVPLASAEPSCEADADCSDHEEGSPDSSEDRDGEDPSRGHGDGTDEDGPPKSDDNRTDGGNKTEEKNRTKEGRCDARPDLPACRSSQQHFQHGAEASVQDARHVSFVVDRENRALLDYHVDGRLVFDALLFGDEGEVDLDMHGATLRIRTNESVLQLFDAPRGNVQYKSANHSLELDLPAGASLLRQAQTERGHFAIIDYGDSVGKLAADRLLVHGDRLILIGHAAFHLEAKPPQHAATPAQQVVQDAITDAEEKRQLGAKISIRARDADAVIADSSEDQGVQEEVTTYDDLEVAVDLPPVLRANDSIDIVVSAELDEGRTVALELDPAVLDGLSVADSDSAAPRYFDLNDDGTWTEVVFLKADSIQDILDATDDGGQPEYWIVEDEQGIQVLVSFPHWSTHKVTLVLEEALEFLTQPSVLVGVVAGIGGVAVAAAALFIPRRREEDLY